jgi:hypothetical protein
MLRAISRVISSPAQYDDPSSSIPGRELSKQCFEPARQVTSLSMPSLFRLADIHHYNSGRPEFDDLPAIRAWNLGIEFYLEYGIQLKWHQFAHNGKS